MLNVCFKNKEKGNKLFLTFWKQEQVDKWLSKNPDYEIIKRKDVLQETKYEIKGEIYGT